MGHGKVPLLPTWKEFTLKTDQKPLVSIYKKHTVEISPRIQRLVVRSFPYQPFNMRYRKGVEIPQADALCRVSPTPMEEDGIQLPIIAVNQVTPILHRVPMNLTLSVKKPGKTLQSNFSCISSAQHDLVSKGGFHKNFIHIGTLGKICQSKMDLQPKVPDFSSLPYYDRK